MGGEGYARVPGKELISLRARAASCHTLLQNSGSGVRVQLRSRQLLEQARRAS